MSQVDNKNASAGKRARTDGGRREDDWTCPSCGNVNFSFRTACNMHNCTQSRPTDHNSKPAPKPLQAPPSYTSSAGYMGPGAPSPMYLGASPYGSSVFSRAGLYDRPFSGGSTYYDYGSRLSVGSPYGPLHLSGLPLPHYSSGSMLGPGGVYGAPAMMDRYGLGLPMGLGIVGSRSGAFPEESSQEMSSGRENDWKCPKCGNNNFGFRTVCNMRKCSTPRPGSQAPKSENSKGSNSKTPEGSWKCEKCNNINYPFRMKCNRQHCGADKPSELNKASDEDDQMQKLPEEDGCMCPLSYLSSPI